MTIFLAIVVGLVALVLVAGASTATKSVEAMSAALRALGIFGAAVVVALGVVLAAGVLQ